MKQPYEANPSELEAGIDSFVDAITETLQSGFLVMPKGRGFVPYALFEQSYEQLRRASRGFEDLSVEALLDTIGNHPLVLVVLRTIMGFSPPEWAYVTSQRTGVTVSEGYIRSLDKRIRENPTRSFTRRGVAEKRVRALVQTADELLREGAPTVGDTNLHRLEKVDTKQGLESLRHNSCFGVPYSMVLYERLLGRPFASHRDAISEMIGDAMEGPIETILANAGIPFRKTRRAERIPGFDQAPDFCIPDELTPAVVIEAKITEDAGTARDKITRVQHLCQLSRERGPWSEGGFQVVACIDGRGFVRRADMQKLIRETGGKVFTLRTSRGKTLVD